MVIIILTKIIKILSLKNKRLIEGKEIMDLISKLVSSPERRLSARGMGEIKAHPFFTGIDWKNLRKSKTPFVPEVKLFWK